MLHSASLYLVSCASSCNISSLYLYLALWVLECGGLDQGIKAQLRYKMKRLLHRLVAVVGVSVALPVPTTLAFGFHCRKDANFIRNRNLLRPTATISMTKENEIDRELDELDELSPPSISFTKNSILFGEKPPTEANNAPLLLWRETKSILPSFVTGAWNERDGDREPVEYLYNLFFIRLPVVLMGIVYINNLLHGHGLFMNFGHGSSTFEVPSVIVFGVIYVILR